jgi:hypothetical protein
VPIQRPRCGAPYTSTLVAMNATARATAAALYALLAVLALGVLAILLVPLPPLSVVAQTPGAALTMGALLSLFIASATLGIVLWRGIRFPVVALRTLALSLPVVAIAWNFFAPMFWVVPLFFIWRAGPQS